MFGLPPLSVYTRSFFSFYLWEIYPFITPFVYPIGLMAQTSSAYLTLCVTIERYVAVCRPLKARDDGIIQNSNLDIDIICKAK
jgi:hypothetical protein